jgi:hypothetical protein
MSLARRHVPDDHALAVAGVDAARRTNDVASGQPERAISAIALPMLAHAVVGLTSRSDDRHRFTLCRRSVGAKEVSSAPYPAFSVTFVTQFRERFAFNDAPTNCGDASGMLRRRT